MKKRALLTLTTVFLLASCQGEEASELSFSNEEISSKESIESQPVESEISESDPDDGLDEIFLSLEDGVKTFVKGDKNGLKIVPNGNNPLFKLTFKTDSDIAIDELDNYVDDSEDDNEISEYTIELDCEESTIETFNRTKNRGYCNRMTFNNAKIGIVKDGTHVIDLNQTYVGYLAQIEKVGTNPKEYENGLYIDLSRAMLSRVTFAPLFDKVLLPAKNYVNMDTFFEGVQNIFPMATTMNAILPTALDYLKTEVRSGILTLDKDTSKPVEEYKIHREIESKQSMLDVLDEILDEAFQEGNLDIERQDIDDAIDTVFDKIERISGAFEINFTEEEFKNIILDFNIKLDDIFEDTIDGLDTYLNVNEFVISNKITLMDQADVNYSTYPTDLTNHNTWKELSL